jgi:uncharacterized protein YbjT (DUF2867 family)
MAHRVFVTGASGFVGRSTVRALVLRGHEVSALVRSGRLEIDGVGVVQGDLFDAESLDRGMRGCDAVIHLVGIIQEKKSKGVTFERIHIEGTRAVLDAARRAGIRRHVQMSALGTRSDAVSTYHRTKFEAEELVRHSGLEWTILRPSMIHGPGGEFMQMEAGWVRGTRAPWLFMPYFGRGMFGQAGSGKIQPVYVEDVARALIDCIDNRVTIGKTYELAGPDVLTWPGLHRLVSQKLVGKERLAVAIPAWYAKVLASLVPQALLPFNQDQVIMAIEDNVTCRMPEFLQDFGWQPQSLSATLDVYAAKL